MTVSGAQDRITLAVLQWTGMSVAPHRFGGTEYLHNQTREIGHIHGNSLVDIPFPRRVRDEVVADGVAQPHHILPESGWVSLFLVTEQDVDTAVLLLRRSYELALRQRGNAAPRPEETNE